MIIELEGKGPKIGNNVYIAPTAVIIGDVTIEEGANIWFGVVIRGDTGRISIGARTSIQDNTVIHVNSSNDTIIESDVTVGHGAVIEGCRIGTGSLIGMRATILSGAAIGAGAFIAAGSVIRENQEIPAHHLVAGVPGKVLKPTSSTLKERIARASQAYVGLSKRYASSARIVS